jgi:transposase-like protein
VTNTDAPQVPPFCPNSSCRFHRQDRHLWRFVRAGFFVRKHLPGRIQRWRCDTCRRYFSAQTFRTDYWLKRPDLLAPIFWGLVSCSAARQIARQFGVSPETVLAQAGRLGRHSLLFHRRHGHRGPIQEPVALDSFESFEYSQYYPTHYHVALGSKSHFCYGFTDTELRRKGRMTSSQKRRRSRLEDQLGRPDPSSTEKEVAELLRILAPTAQEMTLHTDEHQAYPRSIRRVRHLNITHRTISSRAARTPMNPLFPVNLWDLLVRHSGADHKRETIAFPKRRQCAVERMWVFAVWRNFIKSFSEQKRDASPAMRLGVTDHLWKVEEVLGERLFPERIGLPPRWADYYWKRIPTRAVPRGRKHSKCYAA